MNPNLFLNIEECLRSNNAVPGVVNPVITKGSLCRFSYLYVKPGHDQTPLVLITDLWQNYIRGINLNYLTFPTIKNLLQQFGDNTSFSYSNIRGQEYLTSAFRQYKRGGVNGIQKLNSAFILNTLACIRSIDPNEVEAIRKSVREQIRRVTNEQAGPTPETPIR